MEQTMTKYKIVSPASVRIKGIQVEKYIMGIHAFLKKEGCVDGENLFSDTQEIIALDNIQTYLSQKNKTSERHSMDMLLCVAPQKMLLADAKFRVKKAENVKKKEIDDKIRESRDILSYDEYSLDSHKVFIIFKRVILPASQKNRINRKFGNNPKYQFVTAEEFFELFEF